MAITSFTIGGVEVDPILESLDINENTGDVSTLACDVESIGSPVQRFSVHQTIVVQEDGVTIFAGTVTQTRERGFGGPNLYDDASGAPQIVTTITAEDYARLADRVSVTMTVADGTSLKSALTSLIADSDLTTLGVTLDPSQADGPSLPAITIDKQTGSDVLKKFADATGYLYRIDYDKSLRMWLPGDISAPIDIDEFEDPPKWTDDVEVESILGDTYANRVTVIGDVLTEYGHEEHWTGDGVTTTFDLAYKPFAFRVVTVGTNSYQTVNKPGDAEAAMWTYYADTNSITRNPDVFPQLGIPQSGESISFNIDGTFQPSATAEDAAAIAAYGVTEYVTQVSGITTNAAAQEMADAILAERLNSGSQTVSFSTRYTAPTLRAGQQLTISATARDLSGDYIIQTMGVRGEVSDGAKRLIRTVTTKKSQLLSGKWQQTFRDWLTDTSGGATAPTSTTGVGVGPGGRDTDVQVNKQGTFYGKDEFRFYYTSNSMSMGTLSSIDASIPDADAAVGYDCHVGDGPGDSPLPFTTNVLSVAPGAANGVSVSPSGTSWVNGSYVQVVASTPAAWLLAGISVTPSSASHGFGANFEVDVAVGGSGSESVIATFAGVIFGTATPRAVWLPPIAIDAIPAGSRVAVRIRERSTETAAYGVSVQYYAKTGAGNIPYTSQPIKTTADGTGSATALTSGSSSWADGSYVEVVASTATAIAIIGAVQFNVNNGADYEIDIATGGSGSESPIATIRDANGGITDGEPFVMWFPSPISVSASTRIAARMRSSDSFSTSGGVLLMYLEQPLGSSVPSSLLTTSVLKVAPGAASPITLTHGTANAYGSWTEVIASAASDMTLAGVTPTTVGDFDVELGVGSAGNEVSIGVFKFSGGSTGAQTDTALMPIAIGDRIPSGARVAARLRSDVGENGAIVLNYYDSFSGGNVTTTALPAVLPDDGTRATLTPNTSGAWANSGWVQVSPGLPRRSAIYGLVFDQVVDCELEVDVGTGGAGAESVIATVHAYKSGGIGSGIAMLPAPVPVTAGSRLAVRGRRNSTSSSAFAAGVLYYDEFDVAGVRGAIALAYRAHADASRSVCMSVDGNENHTTRSGWVEVFGNFNVTGLVTFASTGISSLLDVLGNTLGDILYRAGGVWQRLAGNTTTTKKFLSQTGTGSVSAAPAWSTIDLTDLGDVALGSPVSDGDALIYDSGSGQWTNQPQSGSPGSVALDDLTDVTLGSPVSDGDVLTYRTGSPSGWVNEAPAGGGGSGSVVLLEQHTASSSAAIDFTSWYSSSYDHYRIDLVNLVPSVNGASLTLRYSTDGGSTWDSVTNYLHSSQYSSDSGATGVVHSETESSAFVGGTISNTASAGGLSGTVDLYAPGSSSAKKAFVSNLTFFANDGHYYLMQTGGWYASTTAVDGIRFLMDSGNIDSGILRIYGIKNS